MSKILFIAITLYCLSNVSCTGGHNNDISSPFSEITINLKKTKDQWPFKISNIAQNVEYIPLETNDSILIGQVNKLIERNGLFYIWDRLSEAIFCFDAEGRFVFQIQDQGRGTNEYIRINDFWVDQRDGSVYIHCEHNQAFFKYTERGSFIKIIKFPSLISSFAAQENVFYCYSGRLPNQAIFHDTYPIQSRFIVMENSEIINTQMEFKYDKNLMQIPLPTPVFSLYADTIILSELTESRIYALNNNVLEPMYQIEFTNNKYKFSYNDEADIKAFLQEKKRMNHTSLSSFYKTDKYLIINYANKLIGLVYVDIKQGDVHNAGYVMLDDINNHLLTTPIDAVDCYGNLYQAVDPVHLLNSGTSNAEHSEHYKSVIGKLKETDNPVIVKITVK